MNNLTHKLHTLKTEIMKDERIINIVAPEGYEVDKERSSFEKIVFRALPEKGLPKTWGELGYISGFWTAANTEIMGSNVRDITTAFNANRSVWPTREEAEASIALAQLCQLRDRYNGQTGTNGCEHRIYVENSSSNGACVNYLFSFKSEELCDVFQENFADLIKKAKPLLG